MDLVYEFDLWAEFGQFFEKKVYCVIENLHYKQQWPKNQWTLSNLHDIEQQQQQINDVFWADHHLIKHII